ncbi:MAG: GGDEF domain-containing protein [Lachnospiraceae bacterium]|nr:GGDEF domain-containing protein [Candidatus Equihabitans merdae]
MSTNMYWITTLIFAIVLFVIWMDDRRETDRELKGGKAYSLMLVYGMFFCLQDVLWGLCDCKVIKSDGVFFVSSSIFHVAIVFTSYYCMKFFLSYLEEHIKHKKVFIHICHAFIVAQTLFVVGNFFYPLIFRIVDGVYVTQAFRPISFLNQYVLFIVCGFMTFSCIKRAKPNQKDKYVAIFWVAIIPLMTGVFQMVYPEAPFYSLGYFLECMIVHMFIITKDRNDLSRERILEAISNSYYTMHLLDLEESRMVDYIESDRITRLIDDRNDLQAAMNKVMTKSVTKEYLEHILKFVDLSQLSRRLKDKNIITVDFIGKYHGWTRASFISMERDEEGNQKKVMFVTQIIEEQKRKEQEMLANSNTDQLTQLSNRRAYENDITKLDPRDKNLVYVSIDLNELKVVNDSLGHEAGDELLKGISKCMKQSFESHGKVYRIGGDEFAVILHAEDVQLEAIKVAFKEKTDAWQGNLVEKMSVSCGYATSEECQDRSVQQMAHLADERMRQNKAAFYRTKGVDRRGQAAAHTALCNLYSKILKINLTEDTYTIVNMDDSEKTTEKGFAPSLSSWLSEFGKTGQVYQDDLHYYFQVTDINYLKDLFANGATHITIQYRRRYDRGFKPTTMQMIPADDYTPDNQTLYLYVRDSDN